MMMLHRYAAKEMKKRTLLKEAEDSSGEEGDEHGLPEETERGAVEMENKDNSVNHPKYSPILSEILDCDSVLDVLRVNEDGVVGSSSGGGNSASLSEGNLLGSSSDRTRELNQEMVKIRTVRGE